MEEICIKKFFVYLIFSTVASTQRFIKIRKFEFDHFPCESTSSRQQVCSNKALPLHHMHRFGCKLRSTCSHMRCIHDTYSPGESPWSIGKRGSPCRNDTLSLGFTGILATLRISASSTSETQIQSIAWIKETPLFHVSRKFCKIA